MKRRKNGEGTWGKKTIKGVVYQYYKDANGNYTYAKTVKEVKEKLKKKKEFIKQNSSEIILNNAGVLNSTTFGEYVKNWLKTRTDVDITSQQSYDNALVKRFYNFEHDNIADKQLKSITQKMLQNYLDTLAEHYSRNSILKTWSPLKQALKQAIKDKEIDAEVIMDIKIPKEHNCKVKTKVIEVIEDVHVEMIYNESYKKFSNGKYVYGNAARVVSLIMYTGMRISEVLALKWEDINWEKRTLKIDTSIATIKKDDGKYITIEKDTKTSSSARTIPLPQRAIDILRDFEKINPNHKKKDFVCLTSNKTLFRARNIERTLANMLTSLGIEENYTPHSLRHGYGSILLSKGLDIKIVSELLGHKDVTTTYNIYIKIYNKDKDKAIDILDAL